MCIYSEVLETLEFTTNVQFCWPFCDDSARKRRRRDFLALTPLTHRGIFGIRIFYTFGSVFPENKSGGHELRRLCLLRARGFPFFPPKTAKFVRIMKYHYYWIETDRPAGSSIMQNSQRMERYFWVMQRYHLGNFRTIKTWQGTIF